MNNTFLNTRAKSKVKSKSIFHLHNSSLDSREKTLPTEFLDNQLSTVYDNDFVGLSKKIIQMYDSK